MHLARIETTSNQQYVFRSSRRRHAIGGSELLAASTTTWLGVALGLDAPDELADPTTAAAVATRTDTRAVRVLTAVSGLAILLAEDRDELTRIIEVLTRRAITEAPGLQIAGSVVEMSAPGAAATGADLQRSLRDSAIQLGEVRARRADRTTLHPLGERCVYSGLPAEHRRRAPDGATVAVSGLVDAQSAAVGQAHRRLERVLGVDPGRIPEHIGQLGGADHRRTSKTSGGGDKQEWQAVLHADGNGVGRLFQHIGDALAASDDLEQAVQRFRVASLGLDRVTSTAVRDAVAATFVEPDDATTEVPVVPYVVGGDDLTLVVSAPRSLQFTRALLDAFRRRTAAWADELAGHGMDLDAASGRDGLSLAAGLVLVRPTHPIAHALELAEELVTSAKQSKTWVEDAMPPATLDVHVLHDSAPVDLHTIRTRRSGGRGEDRLVLAGGPYALDDTPGRAIPLERLEEAIAAVQRPGTAGTDDDERASRSSVQRLRQACFEGRSAVQMLRVAAATPPPDVLVEEHVVTTGPVQEHRSLVIDALELTSAGVTA